MSKKILKANKKMYAPTGQTPGYDFITELEESEQTFYFSDSKEKQQVAIEKPVNALDGAIGKIAGAFSEIGYSTINAVQSAAGFAISRKISAKKMNKL